MKSLLVRAILALVLLTAPAWADGLLPTGSISAVDSAVVSAVGQNAVAVLTGTPSANSTVSQALNGQSMALISVRGTWSGTLAIEVSGDNGVTWSSASALQRGTGLPAPSVTGNGQFQADIAAQTQIRVRAMTLASGTAMVQINLAQGPGLVRVANPMRLIDGTTGNQAVIKPGSSAVLTDTGMVVADAQLHQDFQTYAIATGSKAQPASTGVSLLSVPLPWASSTALEACHRFKVGSGIVYRIKVTLGTGSGSQPNGFLKLYDLAAIPADGTDAPFLSDIVGSTGFGGVGDEDFNATPTIFANGLVACFSTTGGFTKTSQSSPATVFSAQVQ